ncbi:MAG: DNA polymerase IV [Deltaproteobacteria bacterium]|nr:DNA polymerase IV [Deltaproteobacteria bacterium]MDH3927548.1 DNA polymerase IV [Deltaproteobacteria bacterium]MDH3951778.1 DNA polymerase IV [Deltaproteobacteria bacterium]
MATSNWAKAIIHLDMDAFYAAVEVLDNRDLQGKPVIVGGSKERGVVSSASYEARTFGVHSAQPIATAMRLCPQGIFRPVRMWRYKEISRQIFEIFKRFSPLVEPLSLDEAFVDVTGSTRLFGPPEEIAKKIKQQVVAETGLTASAGVAPTKFIAKIASDIQKPDGLTIVPEGKVKEFLGPLPIEKLWGVGERTRKTLAHLGVETIGDLGRVPLELLDRKMGKHGLHLSLLAQGVDEREVETERQVKSIGHEETYREDILDMTMARRVLLSLATKVAKRLRGHGFVGKTVTLKVKYHDFVQITRSVTLQEPTDDGREIFQSCCDLLSKTEASKRPVRLFGISLSQLDLADKERQLALFEQRRGAPKRKRLNRALDTISDKYGDEAIVPGTLLE